VHHEPCGLVGDFERAVQLVGAEALLARIEQMDREPPLAEGYLGPLENGADRDRELALAAIAEIQAGAMAVLLARDLGHIIAGSAAMGANGPVGPAHGLLGLRGPYPRH
jgi:hypothetical protein